MRFYDDPSRPEVLRELLATTPRSRRTALRWLPLLRKLLCWLTVTAVLPVLLLQSASPQARQIPRILTVAGNGTAGYVPAQDGGPATLAELDEPYGTAVDGAGNLYIAERGSNRLRRVDALSGLITTVAGTGEPGFRATDEGGPATAAQLNRPRAVAVDSLGNLYIADTDNHRVRKIDTARMIRTIAGNGIAGFRAHDEYGSAVSAELDSPRAVAVDRFGNVFVGDYNNQRIRKIEATTHVLHTIAGTGTAGYFAAQGGGPATDAEIRDPNGIALDTAGNLYISETGNHRVRRVEAQTGIITTVAGDGRSGYRAGDEGKSATRATLNSPCAVAIDVQGNLYIADMNEHRIRRVDGVTHVITTVTGVGVPGYILTQDEETASAARLNKPRGLAVDLQGALYVVDSANNRIRKVELTRRGVDVAAQ